MSDAILEEVLGTIVVASLTIGVLILVFLARAGYFTSAWKWLKAHALEAGLVVGAMLGVGAAIAKLRGRRSAQRFDTIREEQARADHVLEQREELMHAVEKAREADAKLRERGAEVGIAVEQAKTRIRTMSDAEVAEAFRRYKMRQRGLRPDDVDTDEIRLPRSKRR